MTPPIISTGLICLVTCLFKAIIVARLTRSYLIRDAMAFVPNGSPSLLSHILLSTHSSSFFIKDSYFKFSKLLKKIERWNGDLLYSPQVVNIYGLSFMFSQWMCRMPPFSKNTSLTSSSCYIKRPTDAFLNLWTKWIHIVIGLSSML
jgi:hypothetical protein